MRWQIGGRFDLKAANDEKIQTNGANGVSRGRMRNHHRRLCRNRTRASGRFYSPGERHSSSCARRGAGAQHAINTAISNLQSIESKYCASIERNTRLPGNAGYKSRRALSGPPGLCLPGVAVHKQREPVDSQLVATAARNHVLCARQSRHGENSATARPLRICLLSPKGSFDRGAAT